MVRDFYVTGHVQAVSQALLHDQRTCKITLY